MPELSAPLRLTWDLPADPDSAANSWGALLRARVLFAELAITAENLTGLAALADQLCTPGSPQVTLSVEAGVAGDALAVLPAPCLQRLDLLVFPPHNGRLAESFAEVCRSLALAVWSTAYGLQEFSSALRAAGAAGGCKVAVLNPPAPAVSLTPHQRSAAAAVWARQGSGPIELRVHDLFLARELGQEPFREYAGCQAGSGLAHLDAAGVVTACRTLPVVLGNLGEQELTEIWAGRARRTLRERLAEAPAGCAGCAALERCRGGCRGMLPPGGAEVDLEARDPSCPGPWGAGLGEGAVP